MFVVIQPTWLPNPIKVILLYVYDDYGDDDDMSDGLAASVRGLWRIHTKNDTRRLSRVRLCYNVLGANHFTGQHCCSQFVIYAQRV